MAGMRRGLDLRYGFRQADYRYIVSARSVGLAQKKMGDLIQSTSEWFVRLFHVLRAR